MNSSWPGRVFMVKVESGAFIKCQALMLQPRGEGWPARRLPLPSPLGWSMRSAAFLFFSRMLRILSWPSLAARCRTELPQRSRRLRSAPTLSKSSTTSSCLVITAKCKGVYTEKRQESLVRSVCSPRLQTMPALYFILILSFILKPRLGTEGLPDLPFRV